MDIYKVLQQDHKSVKDLLKQLGETTDKAVKTRAKGFEKLVVELSAHSRAEEEVFYAALKDQDKTHDQVLEGEQEHHMVDVLLSEMSKLKPDDEQWTAKLSVLTEQVEHHVEEEEKDLFGKAKKILSDDQASALADEFKAHKKQHLGQRAA